METMNFVWDENTPISGIYEDDYYPQELIYTWMGPVEGEELYELPDDYLPWDTVGVQECMVKCPVDNQYMTPSQIDYGSAVGRQLYSHSEFPRGICQRSEFCPQRDDWEAGTDTYGDIDTGLCITQDECNAKAHSTVEGYTWSTYSTGRDIVLSLANPDLTEVNNGYPTDAGDFPLQYLCVESCKGMADFVENFQDPTAEYPYDPHGGLIGGLLEKFDPNYKAVTHGGVCLHTCPSAYDDATGLKDQLNSGVALTLEAYHAPYRLRIDDDNEEDRCYKQYACPAASDNLPSGDTTFGVDYFAGSAIDLGYTHDRSTANVNTDGELGILQDKFECITWATCTNRDSANSGGFDTQNYVYHATQHFDHFYDFGAVLVDDGATYGGIDYYDDDLDPLELYTLLSRLPVSDAGTVDDELLAIYWPNVEDYGAFTDGTAEGVSVSNVYDTLRGFAAGESEIMYDENSYVPGADYASGFARIVITDAAYPGRTKVPELRMCVADCANYGYGSEIHRDTWVPRKPFFYHNQCYE
jgi:hypothetical protein